MLKKLLIDKTDGLFLQLFRYTIVGGIAFSVDFGLLYCLTEFVGFHYLISASISFVAGLIVNYVLSKIFVFNQSKYENKVLEFILFTVIGIIGLGLTDLFMWVFTDKIGLFYILSKVITTIIVYLWNFFARKYIVFNKK